MNGQEEICAFAVRDGGSLLERHEVIAPPRQDHFGPRQLREQGLETERDVQHERGLRHAFPHGAGIVAAVSRIDHDPRHAEPELTRHGEAAPEIRGRRP